MACFIVPVAEAIVTTAISHTLKMKEKKCSGALKLRRYKSDKSESRLPFYKKLNQLSKLLWGGSALLAFEHVWHGEVVPWFPFLTAAESAEGISVMLHEIFTVGVTMSAIVTAVWIGMLIVSRFSEKKTAYTSDVLELKGNLEVQR